MSSGVSGGAARLRGQVEQRSRTVFAGQYGGGNTRIRGQPLRNGVKRRNHAVESRLHVALGAFRGGVGGTAETPPFEQRPGHQDGARETHPDEENPPPADAAARHIDSNARERRGVHAVR